MLHHHCPTRHLTVPRDVLDTSLVASFWSPVWLVKWYVSTGETSLLNTFDSWNIDRYRWTYPHQSGPLLLEATFLLFVAPPTVGQGITLHRSSSNHSLTFNPQLILNSLFILFPVGASRKAKYPHNHIKAPGVQCFSQLFNHNETIV